jgi:hypothetical protein
MDGGGWGGLARGQVERSEIRSALDRATQVLRLRSQETLSGTEAASHTHEAPFLPGAGRENTQPCEKPATRAVAAVWSAVTVLAWSVPSTWYSIAFMDVKKMLPTTRRPLVTPMVGKVILQPTPCAQFVPEALPVTEPPPEADHVPASWPVLSVIVSPELGTVQVVDEGKKLRIAVKNVSSAAGFPAWLEADE